MKSDKSQESRVQETHNQSGIAQVLVLVLLLVGIVGGVVLIKQRTNLFPQAHQKKETHKPVCASGPKDFTVGEPCQAGKGDDEKNKHGDKNKSGKFKDAKFTCLDGFTSQISNGDACRSEAYLRKQAEEICQDHPNCQPSALPLPTLGEPSDVACPADVKLCPDGSSVGRVGPNCEFAPCPGRSNFDRCSSDADCPSGQKCQANPGCLGGPGGICPKMCSSTDDSDELQPKPWWNWWQ